MKTKNNHPTTTAQVGEPVWFDVVRDRVSGLRFGVVQIVVHEGRVTQVESTERVRLPFDATAATAQPQF
jgi:hypothetical protein